MSNFSQLLLAKPGKLIRLPFNITADHAYDKGVITGATPGWVQTGCDYIGNNGQAIFSYRGTSSEGVQQFYRNATRTVPLQYKDNTKYYFEIELTTLSNVNNYWVLGIAADSTLTSNTTASPGIYAFNGAGYGGVPAIPGGMFKSGDVIMIAYDTSTNQVFFGKNGVWPVNPVSGTGIVIPGVSSASPPRLAFMKTSSTSYTANAIGKFKTTGLTYPIPTGYIAF